MTSAYYTFSGHSDDVRMVKFFIDNGWNESLGTNGELSWEDEYYSDIFILKSPENKSGVKIISNYITPGVWMFGIAPIDEDYPMTGFKVTETRLSENGYSTVLVLEAPRGCVYIK